MRKKSRFDQTRRARWSRVIFQQARKVLSGSCHSATTRSSRSTWRSCEQEFAFRRPLAAFRVLSSSVSRSCNHEFAFRHHLAALPVYRRPLFPPEKIGRWDVPSPDFFLREEGTSVHRLLAAFQPRVRVLPSSSSVSRSCNHEVTFRHLLHL